MSAETVAPLKAPMPWFGGKGRIAAAIWRRFGNPDNYCEPFFGSGAVLLARPHAPKTETVNDADGLLCNFWRALQYDPDAVAQYADWPVNEVDLHARHLWLLERKAGVERLLADPDAYDAKIAGWWVWGVSLWIGSGWCSGEGPWRIIDGRMQKAGDGASGVHRKRPHLMTDGKGIARQARRLTGAQGVQRADLAGVARQVPYLASEGQGINRQLPGDTRKLPHLSGDGQGVNRQLPGDSRQLPHLASDGRGVTKAELTGDARQLPYLSHGERGVNRKLPYLSHGSRGDASAALAPDAALLGYLRALADRLRRVRVCCGDWSRIVTPAVTVENGLTAVLLDPPYSGAERTGNLYAVDSDTVAADVRRWAVEHGDDPRYRIALCEYDTGSPMPAGWTRLRWKARGGYGSQGEGRGRANAAREVVWFSPHCLPPEPRQRSLFDTEATA